MVLHTNYLNDKLSILKFFITFATCIIVFYLFYYSNFFHTYFKAPILFFQTEISAFFLNLFGFLVTVKGDQLVGEQILVKISGGCDGIEATALFFIALLLFPIPFKYKWGGLLAGLVVLSLLNIFRITMLFLVALYWPNSFEFMHNQGGLYLYAFITILLVFIWSDWALKTYKKDHAL